jgi:putative hydrolase of the HAD superfamily
MRIIFARMLEILQREGRGEVFNRLLEELGLDSKEKVGFLLELYRCHKPRIKLYEDVMPVLEHLKRKGLRLGVVTDGLTLVQRNKVAALGMAGLFDAIVYSELGAEERKPYPALSQRWLFWGYRRLKRRISADDPSRTYKPQPDGDADHTGKAAAAG